MLYGKSLEKLINHNIYVINKWNGIHALLYILCLVSADNKSPRENSLFINEIFH